MAEMAQISGCDGVMAGIASILTSFLNWRRAAKVRQTGAITPFTHRRLDPMTTDAARPAVALSAEASAKADTPKLAFDLNALRDKYRAERDRRLRDDGNEQYQEIKGRFAHYADEP
jgi:hypothetical protein